MTDRITQQQLESYLWGAAVLLRGTIDAGDYKQFIFPLLFFKRLCDVFDEETAIALTESGGDEEFAAYPENHRFQIPEAAHWKNVREAAKNVGAALQSAMRSIETANPDKLYGIFGDAQWTNKDRLSDAMLRDLVEHFSTLELTVANLPEDELGQGYEYLIKKFADDSGHTAAEFYTNRTVVHLMTEMLDVQPGESVYDPTCGSGGMLLSCVAHLRKQKKEWRNVMLYGQERNLMTSSIARMNCFLHGIEDFRIERGDTLAEPKLVAGDQLQQFDVVLANPPYSIKQWDRDAFAADPWGRNLYGTPPQSIADYAFWQHILCSLAPKSGRCAILFPHGVLFRDAEEEMRRKMIDADLIECIVGLGKNLFYNSSMPSCIVICRTAKPKARKGKILLINAVDDVSRERAQSFLTKEHIERIVRAYKSFKSQVNFAQVVSLEEVKKNGGNLNLSLYVETVSSSSDHDLQNGDSVETALIAWIQSRCDVAKSLTALLNSPVDAAVVRKFQVGDLSKLIGDRKEWRRVRLGELVEKTEVAERNPLQAGFERYIKVEHMDANSLRLERWGLIADDSLPPTFYKVFRKGQILYPTRNPHLRRVALAGFDGICGEKTLTLSVREGCESKFLPFVFQSEAFIKFATNRMIGSTNPHVRWRDIAEFEFDLPPLDQQLRIAEILWTVDENVSAQQELLANVKELLSGRGDELLWNTTPESGSLELTYGEVTHRITYGFTNPMPTTEDGPWMVTAKDVLDGCIDYATARHTSQEAFDTLLTAKSRPKLGDVLLTKDGTIGRVAIVDRESLSISQSVALLEPNLDAITPEFLAWSLRSRTMQKKLIDDAGGSAIQHIYITKVAVTPVLVPPIDQQNRITSELAQIDILSTLCAKQATASKELLRTLLDQFVAGRH